MLEGGAHAEIPAAFDLGQILMEIHAVQQRNGWGMADFPIEQRRQAVTAGEIIQELIWREVLTNRPAFIPLGQLLQGALPQHLIIFFTNAPEPTFIERKGIRALKEGPAARPFPFAMLLLQFSGLELLAAPAEIFRRDAMQSGEGRHSKSGENLR